MWWLLTSQLKLSLWMTKYKVKCVVGNWRISVLIRNYNGTTNKPLHFAFTRVLQDLALILQNGFYCTHTICEHCESFILKINLNEILIKVGELFLSLEGEMISREQGRNTSDWNVVICLSSLQPPPISLDCRRLTWPLTNPPSLWCLLSPGSTFYQFSSPSEIWSASNQPKSVSYQLRKTPYLALWPLSSFP